MREEKDSLGREVLPDEVLYSINTIRSSNNFPVFSASDTFTDISTLSEKIIKHNLLQYEEINNKELNEKGRDIKYAA